ncbi:Palmitoyl-monogalactosyldiacylglycerol delta-7 desaturase [Abeliophyllum distichum]|uniref:Palmitoyl-monogalactosyldiacylglycerol delta-7 desaturase n=1 Tax=Abeliophyllum distichum TaxID=126358 RepID=A0ABD1VPS3_9LAMI
MALLLASPLPNAKHLSFSSKSKTIFPCITNKHQESVYDYARNNIRITNNSPKYGFKRKVGNGNRKILSIVNALPDPNFDVLWGRKWNLSDVTSIGLVASVHLLCVFAPFTFNWGAFWITFGLYIISGLFGVTLSYHRHLSHKSFKIPKWLEYIFAYCGVLAAQCGKPNNVGDLEKQPFYKFLESTYIIHPIALGALLYALGGFPYIVWGMGVRTVFVYHGTWLVNSASHTWGKQAWNTGDLSKNNWWLALITFGEGWHNNHHAFEYSARQGLEWWQIDITWYVIRLLEAIGLATDVKLPTSTQKQRMAFNK